MDSKARMAGVFGRAASTYDDVIPFFTRFGEWLVATAGVEAGHDVLDVACGHGASLLPAVRAGARVVGIDLAPEMVEVARRRVGGRADVRVMDAESLAFPDASFDRVLCGFAVGFFSDRAAAFAEWRRVLRQGGTAVAGVHTGPNEEMGFFIDVARPFFSRATGEMPPLPAPFDLEAELQVAGFTDVEHVDHEETFVFSDEERWWAWLHTQGQRFLIDALPPDAVEELKQACFQRLRPHRTPSGYVLTQRVRATLAP